MNLLKSLFVPAYLLFLVALAGAAIRNLLDGAAILPWAAVLLTALPFLAVLAWTMAFQDRARTSPRFTPVLALGAAGALLAAAGIRAPGGRSALLLALAGWGAFLVYAFWYSTFQRRPQARLRLGAPLPRFTLKSVDGSQVDSGALAAGPAILMFIRGNWCPFCVAQVKELAARYRELAALGVKVALVSPQPQAHMAALAERFEVDFAFLADEGNVAARALGIAQRHGLPMGLQALGYDSETVLPTVILTDREGRLVWVHETDNYRVRPEPARFLEEFRRSGVLPAAA